MTLLITIAVLVALAAMLYLTLPLWRRPRLRDEAREQLTILRERLLAQLRELEAERQDQNIDPAIAANEEQRLERELARVLQALEMDAAATPTETAVRPAINRVLLATLIFGLPVAAAALYGWQNKDAIETFAAYRPGAPGDPGEKMPPMVQEMVARLEKRLQANPNDPQGWAQLGRSYVVLERRDDALAAYDKAYTQAPDNLEIVADYAWVLYSADPRRPTPLAVKLYRQIYQAEPDNQDALWVLGLAAYHAGDRADTVKLWTRLQAKLPPGSQAEQGVRTALQQIQAEQKGGAQKGGIKPRAKTAQ